MKYRKKPVVVEAIQYKEAFGLHSEININDIIKFTKGTIKIESGIRTNENRVSCLQRYTRVTIPTLEGEMIVSEGDYIIKGVNGEFYPCKPDIFHKTYEKIEE